MRRGETKDRRGGKWVPLISSQTSADCSVGEQEKEENENESPCFSRPPLPRGQACPVQHENTMRDPPCLESEPLVEPEDGNLSAFFPQCSASKGQKVNNIQ